MRPSEHAEHARPEVGYEANPPVSHDPRGFNRVGGEEVKRCGTQKRSVGEHSRCAVRDDVHANPGREFRRNRGTEEDERPGLPSFPFAAPHQYADEQINDAHTEQRDVEHQIERMLRKVTGGGMQLDAVMASVVANQGIGVGLTRADKSQIGRASCRERV